MAKYISSTILSELTSDFFAFGIPERLGRVFWSGHLPFALWLMRRLSPKVFVELGTETGVSYNAFCWAVNHHHLPTKCFAVDTWEGDAHAGLYDNTIYNELSLFHKQYEGFSNLLRMRFDEALSHFNDRSIDLLHIDGFHTYDAVRKDFESWLPKISADGIILFHDVTVRTGDFGVWKLWDELKNRYPSFLMPHSNGLGVIAAGGTIPPGLSALFDKEHTNKIETLAAYFKSFGMLMEERAGAYQAGLYEGDISSHPLAETIQKGFGYYQKALQEATQSRDFVAQQAAAEHEQLLKLQEREVELSKKLSSLESEHSIVVRLLYESRAKWSASMRELSIQRERETFLWEGPVGRLILGIRKLSKFFIGTVRRGLRVSVPRSPEEDIAKIHNSGLFDYFYYLNRYPDVANSGQDPLEHYMQFGYKEDRWPNPLFDPVYYLRTYEDVRIAGLNPLLHFVMYGGPEGRNPNQFFDTRYYLRKNEDVVSSKINPLLHYIKWGEGEGRCPHPLFNPRFLAENIKTRHAA